MSIDKLSHMKQHCPLCQQEGQTHPGKNFSCFTRGPPMPSMQGLRIDADRRLPGQYITQNVYGREPGYSGNGYIPAYDGQYRTPRSDSAGPSRMNGSANPNVYAVDHLVTWSIGSQHGVLTHEDGMRQLSRLEQESGVYTMRCSMAVEEKSVNIIDGATGDLREQFPLECVRDPVAARDRNSMFNNVALFTVIEDPQSKHSPSEMHIFQVVGRSAKDLVDEVFDAKSRSQSRGNRSAKEQPRRAETYGNITVQDAVSKFESEYQSESRPKPREQIRVRKIVDDEDSEEEVQHGVVLLNKCFDDIERFVARLKQSVQAFRELNRRKHSSRRRHGDGMLTMRSTVPSPQDFVEVFQKFKLSFNILARLRPYLHNPNSAEFVHFLITPLGLVVEASKDPRHDIGDSVTKVVSPLLTKPAVDLLNNCLTSKEYDLWMSLGEAWRTPRNKWSYGHVAAYRPVFSNGWQPPESWMEVFLASTIATAVANNASKLNRQSDPDGMANGQRDYADAGIQRRQSDLRRQSAAEQRSPTRPTLPVSPRANLQSPRNRNGDRLESPKGHAPYDDMQRAYLRDLQQRNAKIYESIQDRKANNAQELSIRKGEILEVLDDSRNWWKCSNIDDEQGFVPYTLVKKYESDVRKLQGSCSKVEGNGLPDGALSPPNLPPPPPIAPPPLPAGDRGFVNDGNWKLNKKSSQKAEESKQNSRKENGKGDFNTELRQRLSRISLSDSNNKTGRLLAATSAQVFIDQYSSADDVHDWLQKKGFQERTVKLLEGYKGSDIFYLDSADIIEALGQQEGSRLASQLKLMKTTAGYTKSGAELKAILARQKRKTSEDRPAVVFGGSNSSDDVVFDNGNYSDDSGDETSGSQLQRELRSKKKQMNRKY